jgi:hypothetical protein
LGAHGDYSRLFLIPLLVVVTIIISSFGYGWILSEEARTGGMVERYEMPVSETYLPNLDSIGMDGGVLFTDSTHHIISLVDQNGSIEWSLNYSEKLVYSQIVDNELYFIDISDDGQYALNCYGLDGVWKSTTYCQPIYYFIHGNDGRLYVSGVDQNYTILYCIEGGEIQWSFSQNGSLVVDCVMHDGKVCLRHSHNTILETRGQSTTMICDLDEQIMLTADGVPLWRMPYFLGLYGFDDTYVANNGTIVLVYEDEGVTQYHGFSPSGTLLWTNTTAVYSPVTLSTSACYYGCQPWQGNDQYDYVESVYKEDRNNASNSWMVLLNGTQGGSVHVLKGIEIFLSWDGQAYGIDPNGSVRWHVQTGFVGTQQWDADGKLGLLVQSESSVMEIRRDGSFWVHDLIGSTIQRALFGPNDSVYILTDMKLVVLDKPATPKPNEYLIVMISADLLIGLGSALWVVDRMVKKQN